MDKWMNKYIPESLSIWFPLLWMYSVEIDLSYYSEIQI